jgi:tetratricopeptide (TPR) repeat protein
MTGYHFISYSPPEALDFVLKLTDALEAGPPPIEVWLDKRKLRPGDWDTQIVEAIRNCESLLFVMTIDSVKDNSVCKDEWTRALAYKKPIIPIKLHPDVELPFRLGNRQSIDFTVDFDSALARLRIYIQWLASPEGVLQAMKDRLADAERDLRRATDPQREARIRDDIAQLEQLIKQQEQVVKNPQSVAREVEKSVEKGLERERQSEKPISDELLNKFINPPPGIAPSYFQDRFVETKLIVDFLKDDSSRIMTVVGRGGIGKTAMVCRVLKSLERGQLPDDMGPLSVNGIVYLSASGSRQITAPNLYSDLNKLLPGETADRLAMLYKEPQISIEAKMRALLEALPQGCIVLLLDNFEDVIDPETRNIRDSELDQVLRALLNLPQNQVKVILTTRVIPFALTLLQPGRQKRINLDEGLGSPEAENLLRQMDADGKLGLRSAPDNLLAEARERTRGYPRALEALYAILAADRDTSLREILDDAAKLLPENVVEVLVGEAFSRLDATAQKVMQALAIYARPVAPAAIDYLLQPYLLNVNSGPVLARLVNLQLVRKEVGRYYLHPVDREYALGRVPQGKEADRDAEQALPFTQFALWHRGADYFKQVRTPRETWKRIEDLEPQLAEFELCYAGHDYARAASVLLEIDHDYLFLWGYYQLIVSLHERLKGKLADSHLEQASLSNLGNAYRRLGDSQAAQSHLEQALTIARRRGDRKSEAELLGSLGLTNADLSHYEEAINNLEQALAIDREIKDRTGEGKHLGWLGNRYFELGQLNRARKYYEEALAIARETRDRNSEGDQLSKLSNVYRRLGNTQQAITYLDQALAIARERSARAFEGWTFSGLGTCYGQLGQISQATHYFEQSLAIARSLRDRLLEGLQLGNLAELLIDEGRYEDAAQRAIESQKIGSEINSSLLGNYSNLLLALTYLYRGDLQPARDAAETSRRYDEPLNNHYVLAVTGLIALRQGDRVGAQEMFTSAVAEADAILIENTDFWVLDSKGLALSGLTLCGHREHLSTAIEAYKAARAITRDMGVVGRVLRLFDALRQADTTGILGEVRQIAGGIA